MDSIVLETSHVTSCPKTLCWGLCYFGFIFNDLPNVLLSTAQLFADDVKLIGNAKSPDEIQEGLNSLAAWKYKWSMSFNVKSAS